MPRRDAYHHIVRRALVKDGWTITDDPYVIKYGGIYLYADLGAGRAFSAEKQGRQIVIEIKVFGRASFLNSFHRATGQYNNYRSLLKIINPARAIYLAVPESEWEKHFQNMGI